MVGRPSLPGRAARFAYWRLLDPLVHGKPTKALMPRLRPGAARRDHVMVGGARLDLPHAREGIAEELALYGVHEPIATPLYRAALRRGQTVVEAGTNIGYYAFVAAEVIGRKGRIIGFEPAPGILEVAATNLERLETPSELHPLALMDREGTVTFHMSEVPNWGTLHPDAALKLTNTVEVEGTTLDAFLADHPVTPDWVRMDIEGGEVQAIMGMADTLERHGPGTFVELHPQLVGAPAIHAVLDVLAAAGYDEATYIDRRWDFPWVPAPVRATGHAKTDLDGVRARMDRHPGRGFSIICPPRAEGRA